LKTRAAILYELGKPLRIEELTIPPLKAGQVLVKLEYSGICRSQLMEVRGKRGVDHYLPHLLGHEGSGTVVEAGEGVTKVKPGDKVILGWIKGLGMDVTGPIYHKDGRAINAGAVTTFTENSIVSENRCVPLPQGIPMDCAVLFGCALPTGLGIVTNQVKPEKGSSVALFGLGGIGMFSLLGLRLYGCNLIIAVDIKDNKLELAKEFGATHTINAAKQDPLQAIHEITDGRGVDYSIETAGLVSTIEIAFQAVRKFGGRCLFASHPAFGEKIHLDPHDLICGKKIEGSWGGSCDPDRDTIKFARFYREGKLPLERLLSRRYRLEEINQAFEDLESGDMVRALIELDHQLVLE
jgi:S-(hydroxymethyl)glutathione dehydrogenase / alcohol dehydrogenase